jgi:hypothetical protein
LPSFDIEIRPGFPVDSDGIAEKSWKPSRDPAAVFVPMLVNESEPSCVEGSVLNDERYFHYTAAGQIPAQRQPNSSPLRSR